MELNTINKLLNTWSG